MLAHVKWFVNEEMLTSQIKNLNSGEWLLITVFIIFGLIALLLIDGYLNNKGINHYFDELFTPVRPYVGAVVRITTGLLLLANASYGYLIAPNILTGGNSASDAVRAIFIFAGFLLIFGLFTRLGAALVAFGYIVALLFVDAASVFDHLEYVGLAIYIYLMGGCKLSCDEHLLKVSKASTYNQYALPALRIFSGAGLIVLAFSEKLLNLDLANQFLLAHDWNLLAFTGLGDRYFIIIAGVIELLIGLSLVLNLATRLTTLALLLTMLATAVMLGMDEVVGHLFAVAIVVAIWVNDTKPKRIT